MGGIGSKHGAAAILAGVALWFAVGAAAGEASAFEAGAGTQAVPAASTSRTIMGPEDNGWGFTRF